MLSVVADTYWNIPGYVLFWGLFLIAFGLFAKKISFLIRLLFTGQQEKRFDRIGSRIKAVLAEVILGRGTLRYTTPKDIGGIGHACLVWGLGLFAVGYFVFIGLAEGFGLYHLIIGGRLEIFLLTVLDIAGLLLIMGLAVAAIKRFVVRPARLDESTQSSGALLTVAFIFMSALVLLHYCLEAIRFASTEIPTVWPPLGVVLARHFQIWIPEANLQNAYQAFWWLNYMIILMLLVYSSRTEHRHPLAAPPNIFFKRLEGKGVLKIPDLENTDRFGVSKIQDFSWKQLLDLYACTECGRCNENCPAAICEKNLKPRNVITNLQRHFIANGKNILSQVSKDKPGADVLGQAKLAGDVVTRDELWECTNCMACMEVCPVAIEHVEKIDDMRRYAVLMESRFPAEYKQVFNNLENFGDNLGQGPLMREAWTSRFNVKKLYQNEDGVDCLFWVGCQGSVDDRNLASTVAAAEILGKAGIKYGILGKEELCCGDPALRMGNEYLFQKLARQNIAVFKYYGIEEIVTACPHCYNVLKNEYTSLGADINVRHFTELIAEMFEKEKLAIKSKLDGTFTYHDPCFLGRYNSIYKDPRTILQSISNSNIREMERSCENSFCCGAGGGNFWKGKSVGRRMESVRIEQAVETGTDGLVTACPFCEIMLDSAIKQEGLEHSFRLKNIIQLVNQVT